MGSSGLLGNELCTLGGRITLITLTDSQSSQTIIIFVTLKYQKVDKLLERTLSFE